MPDIASAAQDLPLTALAPVVAATAIFMTHASTSANDTATGPAASTASRSKPSTGRSRQRLLTQIQSSSTAAGALDFLSAPLVVLHPPPMGSAMSLFSRDSNHPPRQVGRTLRIDSGVARHREDAVGLVDQPFGQRWLRATLDRRRTGSHHHRLGWRHSRPRRKPRRGHDVPRSNRSSSVHCSVSARSAKRPSASGMRMGGVCAGTDEQKHLARSARRPFRHHAGRPSVHRPSSTEPP